MIKINALDKAGRRLELIRFDGEDSFCGAVAEKCGPAALQRLMRGNGDVIGIDTFGESAPASVLWPHFGFTVENAVDKVLKLIAKN